MRNLLDLQISRDLGADSGLSDTDYHVLATLSEAGGHLRVLDLAERMLWSQSRLAHQLGRMERRGLVGRERHPSNSRATIVRLTDAGTTTIREAAPAHVKSVRRHFIELLTPEQLAVLGDVTDVVVAHLHDLGPTDHDGA
jgi:DNA-binding MarR family transcriptional regulator